MASRELREGMCQRVNGAIAEREHSYGILSLFTWQKMYNSRSGAHFFPKNVFMLFIMLAISI